MTNHMTLVPRITKMAKSLQAVNQNRNLGVYHLRLLLVLREMNTTVAILAGLTGMTQNKARERVNDLHSWGLASVVEVRGKGRKIWGMHDDFRAVHKVPTYPSVSQEANMTLKRQKAGRKLEMDEMATILWGEQETSTKANSAALVDIATEIRKAPIETRIPGDVAARRQVEQVSDKLVWSLEDFVEINDEEE